MVGKVRLLIDRVHSSPHRHGRAGAMAVVAIFTFACSGGTTTNAANVPASSGAGNKAIGGDSGLSGVAPNEGGSKASGNGTTNAGANTNAGGSASKSDSASQTSNGGSSSTTIPSRVCEEPTPWPLPTSSQVVGTGTSASCTATALSTAVKTGGNIVFDCGTAPVTIAITNAIQITKATVIDGAGLVTLDGGGTAQILVVASNNSLSVRRLRFTNGKTPDDTEAAGIGGAVAGNWRSKVEVIGCTFEDNRAARGGGAVAVWTGSSLTVVSSRFLRNQSWYGGAVYSLLSPLQVINSEFADNSTVLHAGFGDGGAIGTDGASESPSDSLGGTIQICGTIIRNNQGNGSGGGAYLWMYPPDLAIIDRTSITANTVIKNAANQGAIGGAMRISNGAITIKNSSLISNSSIGNGGGLYLDCAPSCAITNSTFYGNQTAGWGGGIFSGTSSGQINMNNVTFAANNQQNTQGNALFGSASWTFNNSIFVDNNCASMGTGANVLQWASSSKSAGTGNCISGVIAKDPLLASPADNGGPTYTMLPGAGSAALQAGTNCETTDQRGETRSASECDVGAVELP